MLKEIKPSDFYSHDFDEIGKAAVCVVGERVLISVTDAAKLVGKDRKHLIKWLLLNKIALLHFIQPDDSLTAIFFDDFIKFCTYEKNIVDNFNVDIFFQHLVKTGIAKWCQI